MYNFCFLFQQEVFSYRFFLTNPQWSPHPIGCGWKTIKDLTFFMFCYIIISVNFVLWQLVCGWKKVIGFSVKLIPKIVWMYFIGALRKKRNRLIVVWKPDLKKQKHLVVGREAPELTPAETISMNDRVNIIYLLLKSILLGKQEAPSVRKWVLHWLTTGFMVNGQSYWSLLGYPI